MNSLIDQTNSKAKESVNKSQNSHPFDLIDEVNYISALNFDRLIEYTYGARLLYFANEDVVFVFKCAYHLGLRLGEARKLKKESFNLQNLTVRLGKTKTEVNGYASIPPSFKEELSLYLSKKSIGYICRHKVKGTPYHHNSLYRFLKMAGKKLEIPALITPRDETGEFTVSHIFRKSKGKEMAARGAPLNVIQAKLRHSDLEMTSRYLRLNLRDAQAWEREHG